MQCLKTRIPKELIDELKHRFPLHPARVTDKPEELYFAGGTQFVIEFLERSFNYQQTELLSL